MKSKEEVYNLLKAVNSTIEIHERLLRSNNNTEQVKNAYKTIIESLKAERDLLEEILELKNNHYFDYIKND